MLVQLCFSDFKTPCHAQAEQPQAADQWQRRHARTSPLRQWPCHPNRLNQALVKCCSKKAPDAGKAMSLGRTAAANDLVSPCDPPRCTGRCSCLPAGCCAAAGAAAAAVTLLHNQRHLSAGPVAAAACCRSRGCKIQQLLHNCPGLPPSTKPPAQLKRRSRGVAARRHAASSFHSFLRRHHQAPLPPPPPPLQAQLKRRSSAS